MNKAKRWKRLPATVFQLPALGRSSPNLIWFFWQLAKAFLPSLFHLLSDSRETELNYKSHHASLLLQTPKWLHLASDRFFFFFSHHTIATACWRLIMHVGVTGNVLLKITWVLKIFFLKNKTDWIQAYHRSNLADIHFYYYYYFLHGRTRGRARKYDTRASYLVPGVLSHCQHCSLSHRLMVPGTPFIIQVTKSSRNTCVLWFYSYWLCLGNFIMDNF